MRYLLFLATFFMSSFMPLMVAAETVPATSAGKSIANSSITEPTSKHSFSSSAERVALVELYTSEGCSSCPPADEWLSQLASADTLWKNFVPVAFHVDYWDYIGWKDHYASKDYSQRQRRYASERGERTVYTPGVRLGGQEFRGWRRAHKLERLKKGLNVGVLTLDINEDGSFVATFNSSDQAYSASKLNIALLGMDIRTQVERGENRGRELIHDFIVLGFDSVKSDNNQFTGVLPKGVSHDSKQLAVAAWVDNGFSQTPIQAVGGFL